MPAALSAARNSAVLKGFCRNATPNSSARLRTASSTAALMNTMGGGFSAVTMALAANSSPEPEPRWMSISRQSALLRAGLCKNSAAEASERARYPDTVRRRLRALRNPGSSSMTAIVLGRVVINIVDGDAIRLLRFDLGSNLFDP